SARTLLHPHHAPLLSLFIPHPPPPTIYTLSLHDALPIYRMGPQNSQRDARQKSNLVRRLKAKSILTPWRDIRQKLIGRQSLTNVDRKSTRLNSSHVSISYAVFCLKKKTKTTTTTATTLVH